MKRNARQQNLSLRRPRRWGGKRDGAGRKRVAPRPMVGHRTRPKLATRYPVHVTVRMRPGIRRLRNFRVCTHLRRCFVKGQKLKFRVCQFSVQRNHIHMICEAKDAMSLSRGMQGLNIRIARALNNLMRRHGKVFEDRYHARILRFPLQVRHALCYVLQNGRRHGVHTGPEPDPFSSVSYFTGWEEPLPAPFQPVAGRAPPVAEPNTWLLREGWVMHGMIGMQEVPRGRAHAS
ncbi:MAG TPA: transposase [Kofleriaceae bacterium]|nr:transposase [Kofleriaceae bacterium]